MTCTWKYRPVEGAAPITLARNLGFCDYPTRTMSSKTVSVTMPIANIPEFDVEGASLIMDCAMGTTSLRNVTPECDKKSSADDTMQKRSFFFREPDDKPNSLINYIVWGQALVNLGIQGSAPCITFASDLFDLYYYTASEMHPFNEMAAEEWLLIASAATYSFADGYYCVKSFEDGNSFWNSEANFWYLLFNDGFSTTDTWNVLPDDLYASAHALEIAGSVMLLILAPDYMSVQIPRLIASLQKNIYYFLINSEMTF